MQLSRRTLLASALGAAACDRRPQFRDGKIHLRLATWGEQVELLGFRRVIARYQALHPNVVVHLEEISYNERSQVDTQIAAGVGPDLLRLQYLDVGRYTPGAALIDLSPYIPANLGEQFTPQVWAAVLHNGKPHAMPHQTDTSAIIYNKTMFRKLGISVPQSLDQSWHWDEFIDVARHLKKAFDFGFAMNWTMGGSFRWLNFLYQHGGSLLTNDMQHSAIQSDAGRQTLEWTQSFFRKGLVPMSDSAKSSEQLENLFANGVVGMYFDVGPQSIRELHTNFDWDATFIPRDKRFGSELGGNAVGVTRNAARPDIAADFLLFLTNEANMRDFVISAQFLPVRRKLLEEKLDYRFRPQEMAVHLAQSTTVPVELAQTVTLPEFHRIERALGNELDLAFTGGQSADTTVKHMEQAIERALTSA